jgi:hypothetical protein
MLQAVHVSQLPISCAGVQRAYRNEKQKQTGSVLESVAMYRKKHYEHLMLKVK